MTVKEKDCLDLKQGILTQQYSGVELEPEGCMDYQRLLDEVDNRLEEIRELLEGRWIQ